MVSSQWMATWLPLWVKNNWQIHCKVLWGKESWSDILEIAQTINVSDFHVDVNSIPNSIERWYNSITDEQTIIQASEVNPDLADLKDLTLQTHLKIWPSGGEKQHTGGLRIKVFLLTMALIKFVILT